MGTNHTDGKEPSRWRLALELHTAPLGAGPQQEVPAHRVMQRAEKPGCVHIPETCITITARNGERYRWCGQCRALATLNSYGSWQWAQDHQHMMDILESMP